MGVTRVRSRTCPLPRPAIRRTKLLGELGSLLPRPPEPAMTSTSPVAVTWQQCPFVQWSGAVVPEITVASAKGCLLVHRNLTLMADTKARLDMALHPFPQFRLLIGSPAHCHLLAAPHTSQATPCLVPLHFLSPRLCGQMNSAPQVCTNLHRTWWL